MPAFKTNFLNITWNLAPKLHWFQHIINTPKLTTQKCALPASNLLASPMYYHLCLQLPPTHGIRHRIGWSRKWHQMPGKRKQSRIHPIAWNASDTGRKSWSSIVENRMLAKAQILSPVAWIESAGLCARNNFQSELFGWQPRPPGLSGLKAQFVRTGGL